MTTQLSVLCLLALRSQSHLLEGKCKLYRELNQADNHMNMIMMFFSFFVCVLTNTLKEKLSEFVGKIKY